MEYYFSLQFIRLKRWFKEIGINPILGIAISIFVFIFISKLLFIKTELAKWIYPFITLSILVNISNSQYKRLLKIIYHKEKLRIIRMVENGIVALPFLLYLLYEKEYLIALILWIAVFFVALISLNINSTKTIPSPFSKRPFENIIGFRKSFILIGLLYFILFKAIQVDNYNLGMVSFGAIYLVCMSFYLKPEQKYFVWIFNDNINGFLKRKIIDAFICSSILMIPALIGLVIFDHKNFFLPIGVSLIGLIFLVSMIFAKYASYPNEMNVPQGILFALSIWFPPMLLIVIPLYYKRCKQNLASILE